MQIPQSVARFNKYVTNPVQRLWAGWAPSFAIIEHKGRKSGKEFRTPVTAFTTPDGVAILLTYGPDRDWLKNLQAAGGGRVVRRGKTHDVVNPRVVSRDTGEEPRLWPAAVRAGRAADLRLGFSAVRDYQIFTNLSGEFTMGSPARQPNSAAKGATLGTTPLIRNAGGECGSLASCVIASSGRCLSRQMRA